MGKKTIGGLLALCVALAPSLAQAFCGFYVAGSDAALYNNATMVVMMREGQRTVLAMQNNYQGPPENFAMIVPVPVVLQEANVKTLDAAVFSRVDTLASPRLVEYWEQDPCFQPEPEAEEASDMAAAAPSREQRSGGAGGFGVTIEAQFTVGEYEIVILSARDSSGLDAWLRMNRYSIPDGAGEMLRPYVEAGMKFFVAKVDVTKVRFENGQVMLSPLRFHYDTNEFSLPVRLGLLNSNGTQDLIVHILAPNQRYEVTNYPNVTIPTNIDVANEVRTRFGEFYAALFDVTVARNPRAVVTEYSWQASNCDPCPGPVLDTNDLATLGADVLPGSAGGRIASVTIGMPTVTGDLNPSVASAIASVQSAALTGCYQEGVSRNTALTGEVSVRFTVGSTGAIAGAASVEPRTGRDPAVQQCIAQQVASLRFPAPSNGTAAVTLPLTLSAAEADPWQRQMHLQSFVLTRLHARYSKDALGEDLVFRPANAIVGGREFLTNNGRLEEGSQPSPDVNNFQARYAIRHAWEGPIACENPRRGIWGGPPAGIEPPQVRPALDLAFAPRGNVQLPALVKQDIPEIGIRAAAAAQPFTGTGMATGAGAGATAASGGGESSGCGCSAPGTGPAPFALFAVIGVVGLALARRGGR